jgi:hypothetical protein
MQFIYIGDPGRNGDGPDPIHMLGVRFNKGEPVSVMDDAIIAKLQGNSHFEVYKTVLKPKKAASNGD